MTDQELIKALSEAKLTEDMELEFDEHWSSTGEIYMSVNYGKGCVRGVGLDDDTDHGSQIFIVRALMSPIVKCVYRTDQGDWAIEMWANGSVSGKTLTRACAEMLLDVAKETADFNEAVDGNRG